MVSAASRAVAPLASRAGVTGLVSGLALDDLPLVGGLFGGGGGGGGGVGDTAAMALLAALVGLLLGVVGFLVGGD